MTVTSERSAACNRRDVLKCMAAGSVIASLGPHAIAQEDEPKMKLKGRIKQSVSRWCYKKVPMRDFCQACVDMGIGGIDLVGPGDWPMLKEFGLMGTCTPSHSLTNGLNDKKFHAECIAKIRKSIEETAAAGFPNVICFSGNRRGGSEEEGAANCVAALKEVVGLAEEKGVTLIMELLNSKVNHKDYQADHTTWAVDVCKAVGSPRMKVLYDIYHMQIMEGDLIRTIRDNVDYIGHIHTGGNPGRNEIDDTQEINYAAVMKAIAEARYDGWVAHEFVPKRDPLTSLRQAVAICDV